LFAGHPIMRGLYSSLLVVSLAILAIFFDRKDIIVQPVNHNWMDKRKEKKAEKDRE
jgi:hypothetical protein